MHDHDKQIEQAESLHAALRAALTHWVGMHPTAVPGVSIMDGVAAFASTMLRTAVQDQARADAERLVDSWLGEIRRLALSA